MKDAGRVDAGGPGVLHPARIGHRIHMAGESQAGATAAMRHQGSLGHARLIRIVQALDLEAAQRRFDTVGHFQVRDKASAVDRHKLARQCADISRVIVRGLLC
jgi:hypothetical protein